MNWVRDARVKLRSLLLTALMVEAAGGAVRLVLNASQSRHTMALRFLDDFFGSGAQQIALATEAIFRTRQAAAREPHRVPADPRELLRRSGGADRSRRRCAQEIFSTIAMAAPSSSRSIRGPWRVILLRDRRAARLSRLRRGERAHDRQRRAGRCAESDTIGAHGSGDVLDLLLAEIVEGDVEAVAHLLVRRGTEADPSRHGKRLEPGCI